MASSTAKKTDAEVISVLRLFLHKFLQASRMYILVVAGVVLSGEGKVIH